MCKIISIANQKGGVGKTTTAMNLGVALRLQNKRVLLIDLDPQANLSAYLGFITDDGTADELPTISHLMLSAIGQVKKLNNIKDYVRHSKINNIDYIPSDINLANADFYLAGAIARETVLKRMLSDELIQDYDYVIIDCLPSLGILLMNAMVVSDSIIIPVQAQKFAFDGLTMLNNIFEQVKSTLNPKLYIMGILPTVVEHTNVSNRIIEQLTERYSDKLFNTLIHKSTKATESTIRNKSLCLNKSRLGEEYKTLAVEVIERTA